MAKKEIPCSNCKIGKLMLVNKLSLKKIPIEKIVLYAKVQPVGDLRDEVDQWAVSLSCTHCNNPKLDWTSMKELSDRLKKLYNLKPTQRITSDSPSVQEEVNNVEKKR